MARVVADPFLPFTFPSPRPWHVASRGVCVMANFLNSDFSFAGAANGRVSLAPQTSAAPSSTWSFPKLPVLEIVKCLAELGINVSKDELLHPENNKETIKKLYECLLEICLGINRDELMQPAFSGLHMLDYPELHEESVPVLNYLRAVTRMMEVCQIQDFSLRDITMPNAVRLNKQLSGIINYVKFREEKLLMLEQLSATREDILNRMAQCEEKNDSLSTRLSLLREQTREEGETIGQLESDCGLLEQNIMLLRREEEALDRETLSLTDKTALLDKAIAEALAQSEDLSSAQQRLSAQVVTSPEKFRKQILEDAQALQHEQRDAKIAEKRVKDLNSWQANLDSIHADVSLALDTIEEVRAEVNRQKAIIADLETNKQSLASQRESEREIAQSAQQLQRACGRAEEKLAVLRKQASARAEEAQHSLDLLHKQLLDAEAFRLQLRAKMEKAEGEVSRAEKEIEAEAFVQEQEVQEIKAGYHKLEKKVISHLHLLRKALDTQGRSAISVA